MAALGPLPVLVAVLDNGKGLRADVIGQSSTGFGIGYYQGSSTALQMPTCSGCGGFPHPGGIATCPNVKEVEYDSYGHVKRIVKR